MAAHNKQHLHHHRREQQRRIVQVIPTPQHVMAVYREENGGEFREPVTLIALYSDGSISFLNADADGIFDCPDEDSNFARYEFG